MDLKSFGERLHALRKGAGLSQERLVEALDQLARHGPADDYRAVDATLLSRWENARSQSGRQWKPTRPYVLHLIRIFAAQLTAESAQKWADEAGYQLTPADFVGIFPASIVEAGTPETQSPKHNLPAPLTSFVGREREIATLLDLLADPSARLVTIVGEGGAGKTRLALAAAQTIVDATPPADGVWFVPLAGVEAQPESPSGGSLLVAAVAKSLSFAFHGAEVDPATQLIGSLRSKSQLLILDNFEHLTEQATFVTDLLESAPNIRVWATSRLPLNCQAEHVLALSGLPIPPAQAQAHNGPNDADTSGLIDVPSVRLFIERARQRNRAAAEFDAAALRDVARLCRLVDGSPLALELAANWVGHLSMTDVVDTLKRHDASLLSTDQRDVPARHRSMSAVFEASWQLLSPERQRALARLSVFRGAFTREAAVAVTETTVADLAGLVNRSLLSQTTHPAGATSYVMHELLRQFAGEKLAQIENDLPPQAQTAQRHANFYLRLLGQRGHTLYSSKETSALAEISAAVDNIRAAWQWAVAHEAAELLSLSWMGLRHFYHVRGLYHEAEDTFCEAAAHLESDQPNSDLAVDLQTAHAFFLNQQHQYDQAATLAQDILARLSDQPVKPAFVRARLEWGIALSLQSRHDMAIALLTEAAADAQALQLHTVEARALHAMYRNLQAQGNFAQANDALERAANLYRRVGYLLAEGFVRDALGHVAMRQGSLATARRHYEGALSIYGEAGDDVRASMTHKHLGVIDAATGQFSRALAHFRNSLAHEEGHDPRNHANTLDDYARLLGRLGQYAQATRYAEEAVALNRRIGYRVGIIEALCTLGWVRGQRGDAESALTSYREAAALIDASGARTYANAADLGIGEALADLGRMDEAREWLQRALTIQRELGQRHAMPVTLSALARIALAQGRQVEASTLVDEVLTVIGASNYEHASNMPGMYWACYQVLRATGDDERAARTLQTAHELVQAQAASLDENLRISFLAEVKVNREIAAVAASIPAV
jgi:predicted ATPase/transcriptional regulator with XRE-family HTH domain/Flp pilus assembly protein TadD